MQNKLPASAFKPYDYEVMRWVVYPEAGTPFETILKPEYWTHVARDLRQWNRIEVRPADGSYLADLVVLACGPLYARVKALEVYQLGGQTESTAIPMVDDPEFKIEWAGAARWRVRRKSDGEVMVSGLDKDDANAWIVKYRRQVPAAA